MVAISRTRRRHTDGGLFNLVGVGTRAKAGVPDVPNVGAFLTLTRETDDASWRR